MTQALPEVEIRPRTLPPGVLPPHDDAGLALLTHLVSVIIAVEKDISTVGPRSGPTVALLLLPCVPEEGQQEVRSEGTVSPR